MDRSFSIRSYLSSTQPASWTSDTEANMSARDIFSNIPAKVTACAAAIGTLAAGRGGGS